MDGTLPRLTAPWLWDTAPECTGETEAPALRPKQEQCTSEGWHHCKARGRVAAHGVLRRGGLVSKHCPLDVTLRTCAWPSARVQSTARPGLQALLSLHFSKVLTMLGAEQSEATRRKGCGGHSSDYIAFPWEFQKTRKECLEELWTVCKAFPYLSPLSFPTPDVPPTQGTTFVHKPVLSHPCASPLHSSFQEPLPLPAPTMCYLPHEGSPYPHSGGHRCAPGGSRPQESSAYSNWCLLRVQQSSQHSVYFSHGAMKYTITVTPILQEVN